MAYCGAAASGLYVVGLGSDDLEAILNILLSL